jgi:hypothetical protein
LSTGKFGPRGSEKSGKTAEKRRKSGGPRGGESRGKGREIKRPGEGRESRLKSN